MSSDREREGGFGKSKVDIQVEGGEVEGGICQVTLIEGTVI